MYKVQMQWPRGVYEGQVTHFTMPPGSRLSGRTGTATAPPGARAGDTAYMWISDTDDPRAHQLAADKLKAYLRSKGLEAGSSVDVPARLDHAEEDFLEHTERQAE